jgi:dihydrofolate reductase
MGRILYSMQVSLDGYIASRDGEPGFGDIPDDEMHNHYNAVDGKMAIFLYGRRMYEVMRFWETADRNPGMAAIYADYAKMWQRVPKIVASTTLTSVGANARLISGDVEAEIIRIKAATDGDIAVAGANLGNWLLSRNLVDEIITYRVPVLFGGGTPFFADTGHRELHHIETRSFTAGVVMSTYRPKAPVDGPTDRPGNG